MCQNTIPFTRAHSITFYLMKFHSQERSKGNLFQDEEPTLLNRRAQAQDYGAIPVELNCYKILQVSNHGSNFLPEITFLNLFVLDLKGFVKGLS